MYQIDVTLQATEQLAQVVGLRRRVRHLITILSIEPGGAPGAFHGVRGSLHKRTA
jgi:hypothetical protein